MSTVVEAGVNTPVRATVTFENWGASGGTLDYFYFDREKLDFGKRLVLEFGPDDDVVFGGVTTGIEGEFPAGGVLRITVHAADRLAELEQRRRTRTFEDVSFSDVFGTVSGENGLQADVDGATDSLGVVVQHDQTDYELLVTLAARVGLEIWVDGSRLHAAPRGERGLASHALQYAGRLREFSVLADAGRQATRITVRGWNRADKEASEASVAEAVVAGEISGGHVGAHVRDEALDANELVAVSPWATTDALAAGEATAAFRVQARRFLTGRGVVAPDWQIRVGTPLDLEGVGPLFDGRYQTVGVRWTYDRDAGPRTEFTVERPDLGA